VARKDAEIILFNKPFRVLSQFTDDQGRACLKDFIDSPEFYPAGRLDFDSEGLLILTNNGKLQSQITQPRRKVWKTYCVQLDGQVTQAARDALVRGLALKDGMTQPAKARLCEAPDWLWDREPPVRYRKTVPTSWLSLSICEGRNRQVRRMCAAVGFPVLRLIRVSVGPWSLKSLEPGQWTRTKAQFKN